MANTTSGTTTFDTNNDVFETINLVAFGATAAPTIVTGAITLGFVQQITRAFGRVEGSLQYLVKSWSTIVELISVWKRLREFEEKLKSTENDLETKSI